MEGNMSFGEHVGKLKDEIEKNNFTREEDLSNEKTENERIGKMQKLIENRHFALNANDETKKMIGKAWFKNPLGQKMEGMFYVDEKGDVFELDFKSEDFLGTLPGQENLFLDKIQNLLKKVGLDLCVINADLQRAFDIEKSIKEKI